METSIEALFQELSAPTENINDAIRLLNKEDRQVLNHHSIFPYEAVLNLLSSDAITNFSKTILLYIIGLLAELNDFQLQFFENDDAFALIFSFLSGKNKIREQAVRVFQSLVKKSVFISNNLLGNDFLAFVTQSPPFFRTIDAFSTIIKSIMNGEIENPFSEESLEMFLEIFSAYMQSGEKEIAGALEFLDVLFDFYKESEESIEVLDTILNDEARLNLRSLMKSENKKVVNASAKLLLRMAEPSIQFVDLLINGYLDKAVPLDLVFSILFKNTSEWSGYNKDIIVDFIRNNIPIASFNTAKIGIRLYLSFCNLAEEWDFEIASAIAKFASEEDMAALILRTFVDCLNSASDLSENEDELESIINEIQPIAEDELHSDDPEISGAAFEFLSALEAKFSS